MRDGRVYVGVAREVKVAVTRARAFAISPGLYFRRIDLRSRGC
jgi:hypothetical protein